MKLPWLLLSAWIMSPWLNHAHAARFQLSATYPKNLLAADLLPRDQWRPYPRWEDRDAWQSLPKTVRERLIAEGEPGLGYAWPALPATVFLEFARNGNRSHYQDLRSARRRTLANLVLAECAEGRGRFLDDIVNGIWATCEESYWGVPAHLGMQRAGAGLPDVTEPTVDLFAAETASLLAWTSYLLDRRLDAVSPRVRPRIQGELERRILGPCRERDDFWWMGLHGQGVNNWNPWCCSNWLTTVLLMEPEAGRRIDAAEKILSCLDRFLAMYGPDGGCDEGPSYWARAGGSLFDCLELLYDASNGGIQVYDQPLIRQIGRYIYRVHIDGRYFVNFADAPASVNLPAGLVYRYGQRIGDRELTNLGAWTFAQQHGSGIVSGSIGRRLPAIFHPPAREDPASTEPHVRDAWFRGIQVMTARSAAGSARGLFVAAKGGHNAESHNHNDVGNFIVYLDGAPMIIDLGVGTYTRKTFSSHRYEIWTMQSAYHNLPTIDGIMQHAGRQFAARRVHYSSDKTQAELTLDIAGAYPPKAGLRTWTRSVRLIRGHKVVVDDHYRLVSRANQISLTLITPCTVTRTQDGRLRLRAATPSSPHRGRTLDVAFPPNLQGRPEIIPIKDDHLKAVWGDHVTRLRLVADHPPLEGQWVLEMQPCPEE